jgi:hypothetical protein
VADRVRFPQGSISLCLFELAFEDLVPVLKPGRFISARFCDLVGLPYFEMERQDNKAWIPPGTVIFSSELPEGV